LNALPWDGALSSGRTIGTIVGVGVQVGEAVGVGEGVPVCVATRVGVDVAVEIELGVPEETTNDIGGVVVGMGMTVYATGAAGDVNEGVTSVIG